MRTTADPSVISIDNPHRLAYLTKLVNMWPASRIDELMPWAYAKIRGAAVKV